MSSATAFKIEPVLPHLLRVRMKKRDADGAVCGSATDCANVRGIVRTLREQGFLSADAVAPTDFYVKVRPNRLSITLDGVYHYYNMPDQALKILQQNDANQYELIREGILLFRLLGTARRADPESWRNPERRAQVLAAKAQRKAEGRPDRRYPNLRIEAARRAGVRGKKLGKEQAATA